ncbi:MAG: L-threonylcarbamoyladenylate synthase [Pseudomonadota bacterium]
MATLALKPTPEDISTAVNILRQGGIVAVPTETVYGLAADASNADAVARLYAVKGRPAFNPLIAHVNGPEMAAQEGDLSGKAGFCAGFYWPGPLTIVVPVAPGGAACELARAGLDTIGLRHPSHSVTHDIITRLGRPIVAPSANRSGRISPVTPQDVYEELGDDLDAIVDGGRCPLGLESTVVSFTGQEPALLRPGGVERAVIERFLGTPLATAETGSRPESPGQLSRHYAPNARLRLDAKTADGGEVLVGFGHLSGDYSLSPRGDLKEAAANLYPLLRYLDRHHDQIAIGPIPRHGLGEAINDRLQRAAARDEPC